MEFKEHPTRGWIRDDTVLSIEGRAAMLPFGRLSRERQETETRGSWPSSWPNTHMWAGRGSFFCFLVCGSSDIYPQAVQLYLRQHLFSSGDQLLFPGLLMKDHPQQRPRTSWGGQCNREVRSLTPGARLPGQNPGSATYQICCDLRQTILPSVPLSPHM